MKEISKCDVLAFNELMSLVKDSITSCDGIDGMCDKILVIAAKLICDNKYNFQKLLSFALDESSEMSNILTTVMYDNYNMMDTDMSLEDMEKLLSDKCMTWDVFKKWFTNQDKSRQATMIKELLDYTI